MPELPDLQAFSHNLTKQLHNKKVKTVTIPNAKKLKTSVSTIKKALEDDTIKEVKREGKELHIIFKSGNMLGLHLMLHGQLFISAGDKAQKHPVIELHFADDTCFTMSDYQGIATPALNPEKNDTPDALDARVDHAFLAKKLAAKKTSVKAFLLDQHNIRGIGNAYADEILWDAGISPFSICSKIPDSAVKKLAKSIKSVLHDAEKQILKTHPDIISGEVRDFLKIHNSRKTHSPGGAVIHNKTASSRKSYFTDEQELYN